MGTSKWIGLVIVALLAFASCKKATPTENASVFGRWGCEQYVSCRTNDDGTEQWVTLHYLVGPGCEYELFFNEDGTGSLKLNNSPAFIKEFSCLYQYHADTKKLDIKSSTWMYALYGDLFSTENLISFDVETLTDKEIVASWTNNLAEEKPFFERFFIKRID